jgi:SAM-dependent methyltransferase
VKCRHCASELQLPFIDLGSAPASNAFLTRQQLRMPEKWYPLRVLVCESCWLVQTEDYIEPSKLFPHDYAYLSSISTTWLDHAQRYVAAMIDRIDLGPNSLVAEIGANDGYLLQFVRERGIPCYGVEPTKSAASAAREKGLHVIDKFFSKKLAAELAGYGRQADLVIANNVLAHVPDINDFVSGVSSLLKPSGIATFEFPYLLNLVRENQFDTIYHEHYSYFALTVICRIFLANGLEVFDVEEVPTHGGSLRVFAHRRTVAKATMPAVPAMLAREQMAGVSHASFYTSFQSFADNTKNALLAFILQQKLAGRKLGAYGAAAKGNTLLNFAGVRSDLLPYVVDRNPMKQGSFLPGSRIPIVDEHHLRTDQPDWVLVLPWNLREEIEYQLAAIRDWGGRFVYAIPRLETS